MKAVYTFRLLMGCLFLATLCNGQSVEERRFRLNELSIQAKEKQLNKKQRVLDYVKNNNVPLSYIDSKGNYVLLVDVTETGIPIYKATHNAAAATTTGVVKLRENGGLGLNLQGEGMTVGVWDGGIVASHIDFGTRILSTQGSTISTHATHVSGTIGGAGTNNTSSKGMAPKASLATWDFDNDEPEMIAQAKPDQTTLLISNHSYGSISGWRQDGGNWTWYGDPARSTKEDYKFGFYDGSSKLWDEIAFNAPYYTIFKSAGNDRSDTGTGAYPPDCNEGSGFDCLTDASNSKNIMVVGAVKKVASYNGPSSVEMSTFSSWGPTDDGRIKPDIVAVGVDVFSTSGSGTNQYTTLSGTSMSSPNAAGSLTLIQELNKKLYGSYLRSATLKALAIHTAKEAGANPGPDYMFGWGLLDVEASAKFLLNLDGQNLILHEQVLNNNQTFEIELNPKPNTKITATLVWTDPAGNPVSASLDPTNIMLVNDLDLRLRDDGGNEFLPWILDPSNPTAPAIAGNNIRDNVEKLEFSTPQPRKYILQVKHKGQLQGQTQAFSVLVSYTSVNDPRTAYYWIGNSGNWNDGTKWSLTSGGVPSNVIPSATDRVFFDENSFSANSRVVTLTGDAACSSLTWLSASNSSISLNGFNLTVSGNFVVTSPSLSATTNGSIIFTGQDFEESIVNVNENNLTGAEMIFNGDNAIWRVTGRLKAREINLIKGSLHIPNTQITANKLISNSSHSRTLDLRNSALSLMEESDINGTNLVFNSTNLSITAAPSIETKIDWQNVNFNGELITGAMGVNFTGSSSYNKVILNGNAQLQGNNSISTLEVKEGVTMNIADGAIVSLGQNTKLTSNNLNRVSINSMGSGKAFLNFSGHYKLCFDYLTINNIDLTGSAIINAGLNSTLTNSANWIADNCNDVLFPDFTFAFNCLEARVEFTNISSGDITSWHWDFGDENSPINESTNQHAAHIYTALGTYTVTLTVSNSNFSKTYSRVIEILPNTLSANQVVLSNNRLYSVRPAASYQWYKNNIPISGATERGFEFAGEAGAYYVVTKGGECNRVSSSFIISATEDEVVETTVNRLKVFPNPSPENVNIEIPPSELPGTLHIYDNLGKRVGEFELQTSLIIKLQQVGLYNFVIKTKQGVISKRILIVN